MSFRDFAPRVKPHKRLIEFLNGIHEPILVDKFDYDIKIMNHDWDIVLLWNRSDYGLFHNRFECNMADLHMSDIRE